MNNTKLVIGKIVKKWFDKDHGIHSNLQNDPDNSQYIEIDYDVIAKIVAEECRHYFREKEIEDIKNDPKYDYLHGFTSIGDMGGLGYSNSQREKIK